MIWIFLAGVSVGAFALFVVLLLLAWREEMELLRAIKGEIDNDDE